MKYFVYTLRCGDGSFYSGVTDNLRRRLREHKNMSVRGYTASRQPVKLIGFESFPDIDSAFKCKKLGYGAE